MAACIEAATLDAHRSETIDLTERIRRALDLRDAEAPPGAKSLESPRPLDTAEMEALFDKTLLLLRAGSKDRAAARRPATAATREREQHLAAAEAAVSDGDWARAPSAGRERDSARSDAPGAHELQTEIEEARARPPAPQTEGNPRVPRRLDPPRRRGRRRRRPGSRRRASHAGAGTASGCRLAPAGETRRASAPVPSSAATAPRRHGLRRNLRRHGATARKRLRRNPRRHRPEEAATAPIRQATPPPAARRETPPIWLAAAAALPKSPLGNAAANRARLGVRRPAIIGSRRCAGGRRVFLCLKPRPAPPQTVSQVLTPRQPIEGPPPPSGSSSRCGP